MADEEEVKEKEQEEPKVEPGEKKGLFNQILPWIIMVLVIMIFAGAGLGVGRLLAGTKQPPAQESSQQNQPEKAPVWGSQWFTEL